MPDLAAQMKLAVDLHVRGKFSEAETAYRNILRALPAQFDATHNLGVLLLQCGKPEAALDYLNRAAEINPRSASARLNIGNALRTLGCFGDALDSYDVALAINPSYAEAYNNRGVVLRRLGRSAEALDSYERALAIKPAYAEAHNNRATVLREDLKKNAEALAAAERALALDPKDADAHLNRAHALAALKRYPEAIAGYRSALDAGGNRELLSYYLSALGAEATPATAPRRYVESLFDQYAPRFDESLNALNYRVPEQLYEAVASFDAVARRDIADLGCGTGLCAPFFDRIAGTLVGVDVSEAMLAKAAARGLYDDLVRSDLVEFLNGRPAAFDLLIAADVFIYVGALESVFAAARVSLRPGGQLAFSVEVCEGDGFIVRPSRRFAHSLPYLAALATGHGFNTELTISIAVRQEEGQDIPGYIVVLTRDKS